MKLLIYESEPMPLKKEINCPIGDNYTTEYAPKPLSVCQNCPYFSFMSCSLKIHKQTSEQY